LVVKIKVGEVEEEGEGEVVEASSVAGMEAGQVETRNSQTQMLSLKRLGWRSNQQSLRRNRLKTVRIPRLDLASTTRSISLRPNETRQTYLSERSRRSAFISKVDSISLPLQQ
jgi:hypothetical protein